MRIVVLCTDQGVRVPGTKGASLHLAAITHAFARLGHDVLLVGIAGGGTPPPEVRCLLFPHPGRSEGVERERRKLALVDRVTAEAEEPLVAFAPDVVYERLSLFGTAGIALAATTGAAHVLEINALLAEEESKWRGLHHVTEARRRQQEVLERSDFRVCVSEETARRVASLAPGPATITIPNGVDTDHFRQLPDRRGARRHFGLPAGAPMIGFVGSLRPWHGLDIALEALVRLPDVHLVVAGDGPLRFELTQLAADLGVTDRVRWLGAVPHDDVPGLLAALDVALAPYPNLDDFAFSPLKLFEYLAAGVPVVASDLGQIRAALEHGRFGELVTPGDADALASAIQRTLRDESVARDRAALARSHALATHDWTARASDILDAVKPVAVARIR